jgi:hypothetical protein
MATVTLNLDEELSKVTQEMAEERHASVDEVILDPFATSGSGAAEVSRISRSGRRANATLGRDYGEARSL